MQFSPHCRSKWVDNIYGINRLHCYAFVNWLKRNDTVYFLISKENYTVEIDKIYIERDSIRQIVVLFRKVDH